MTDRCCSRERYVDAVSAGVDGHDVGATADPYGGDNDGVAGAVDDGDIVAVIVGHVDAVRVAVNGRAARISPDRYGGDDHVAGAVDDGDVVAVTWSRRRGRWWGSRPRRKGSFPPPRWQSPYWRRRR